MRRLALTLATAVLASGCIIGDDHNDNLPPVGAVGSAIVYWDFLRNVPAQGASATVLYDDAAKQLTGSGACLQSAVDFVTVDVDGQQFPAIDCVFQGVQGATLDGLPVGSPTARIIGWRRGGSTDVAVYDTTVALRVFANTTTDQGIFDVPAVSAPIDLFGDLAFGAGPTPYDTCAQADVPNIAYDVWDSFGTKILTGVAGCSDPLPAPVFVGDLDLDNYTVRMQGTATQGPFTGQKTFDSCVQSFDHFDAQIGGSGVSVLLRTQPQPICQ